jgi:MFS family permease
VPTTTLQFISILIALVLCIFCVALDNTIIVTAIPRITDGYKTLNDVGWYASAFNLPAAALVPFFGKLYAICPTKRTFLVALFIFEVGSLISAVAPTSAAFIVGRALSGAGSAGIFNGALVTLTMITPLEKRPAYQSFIGITYAFATTTAPLIGGVFTDSVSWRWYALCPLLCY